METLDGWGTLEDELLDQPPPGERSGRGERPRRQRAPQPPQPRPAPHTSKRRPPAERRPTTVGYAPGDHGRGGLYAGPVRTAQGHDMLATRTWDPMVRTSYDVEGAPRPTFRPPGLRLV
jgi:hypothetical protein